MTTKDKPHPPATLPVIGNIVASTGQRVGNIRLSQADVLPGVPEDVAAMVRTGQAQLVAIHEPTAADWAEIATNVHPTHENPQ